MNDYTTTIYCFLDDYLQVSRSKDESKRKINDAELLTTVLLAARYFRGNYISACLYMESHHGMQHIDKSHFNRRLHGLDYILSCIFFALGNTLKELNTSSKYLIDTFPVAICKNIRIPRSRFLKDEIYRGFNASKKEYFYGFKVQVITTEDGVPIDYLVVAGSLHDSTSFQMMNIDLPEGSQLFADSAYTIYEVEDLYREAEKVELLVDRKSNSKRMDTPTEAFLKKHYRKRIETTFSQVTEKFPKKIHAVTLKGFLIKILLFLLVTVFENLI
ncbi:transposase family protein [Bernardetia litoralis DSM 6794]|uniref:Transposase family protein n=1 Tax=Bernardetia litoralis (strain ATCC 23117 / DSM 6794 / NBRC 15988 / NCIMB 1366 / Fx l1 / Sio-4) TaxID=880071 RepID=I4AFD4_BERLS|nr:IS982 family transposase [Bernardetia litoralis]AFM02669.1 transposase family protein [Bernardetia litoralis DSM 6794]